MLGGKLRHTSQNLERTLAPNNALQPTLDAMKTTIKKTRANLAKLVDELLVPAGFVRKGTFFVRDAGPCLQIIQLQGSQHGEHTYLNQNVWFKALGSEPPSLKHYHASTRPERNEKRFGAALTANGAATDRSNWKSELESLLSTALVPWEDMMTVKQAAQNMKKRRSGWLFWAPEIERGIREQHGV
jgi:hypothetical protein